MLEKLLKKNMIEPDQVQNLMCCPFSFRFGVYAESK